MRGAGAFAALAVVAASCSARAEPWDGPDKRLHFVAGVSVAAHGTLLAHTFDDLGPGGRALAGFALGTAVGAAKEGADGLGLGHASAADFAWTVAGAFVGASLTWLLSSL